jgi:hypothetical protein
MHRASLRRHREEIGGSVLRFGDEDHDRLLADGETVHQWGKLASGQKQHKVSGEQ